MIIGITGHQRLPNPSMWKWVEESMNCELDTITPPVTAVSSLAIGADQLFAKLVLQRGGSVHAIIPFANYQRTFDGDDLHIYQQLLKLVSFEILTTPGTDEDAYLAAGQRIVELSDRIIAVWDGKPARGKGGTGDIVAYAIASGIPLVHINPIQHTVVQR
ncbi:MAG: hypothetical protein QNJ47_06670 [Nostocaceae cyanobacterium]|nr:hypothetical protein [Nostocaceae cyanobacterium]